MELNGQQHPDDDGDNRIYWSEGTDVPQGRHTTYYAHVPMPAGICECGAI